MRCWALCGTLDQLVVQAVFPFDLLRRGVGDVLEPVLARKFYTVLQRERERRLRRDSGNGGGHEKIPYMSAR